MSDYSGKINRVVRGRSEALKDDERGVLRILPRPQFQVVGRDMCHAEYITADGEDGQVCTPLRERDRFYVRGPHAAPVDAADSVRFHNTIESALSEAMRRTS